MSIRGFCGRTTLLDFGDLINETVRLFRTRPAIIEEYRRKFKYILVDEFQDTNIAQFELIRLLAGEKANLTVVGRRRPVGLQVPRRFGLEHPAVQGILPEGRASGANRELPQSAKHIGRGL